MFGHRVSREDATARQGIANLCEGVGDWEGHSHRGKSVDYTLGVEGRDSDDDDETSGEPCDRGIHDQKT